MSAWDAAVFCNNPLAQNKVQSEFNRWTDVMHEQESLGHSLRKLHLKALQNHQTSLEHKINIMDNNDRKRSWDILGNPRNFGLILTDDEQNVSSRIGTGHFHEDYAPQRHWRYIENGERNHANRRFLDKSPNKKHMDISQL